jgi:hypothetical protein
MIILFIISLFATKMAAADFDPDCPRLERYFVSKGGVNFNSKSDDQFISFIDRQPHDLSYFTKDYFRDVESKAIKCGAGAKSGWFMDTTKVHEGFEAIAAAFRKLQVARAAKEMNAFKGRILSEAEFLQARQLEKEYPELSEPLQSIILSQEGLRREAEERERKAKIDSVLQEQRARAEETQRAVDAAAQEARDREEAERQKQKEALDRQNEDLKRQAAELAQREMVRKQNAFRESMPPSCKSADTTVMSFQTPEMKAKLAKAPLLIAAGETRDACKIMITFLDGMDGARKDYVACSKALDGSSDPLARQAAQNALEAAIGINFSIDQIQQSVQELHCR